jgi:CBS-domain-containing membrane protein
MSTPALRSLVCVTSGLWAQRIDSVQLGQEERAMQASDIMTHDVVTVRPDTPLDEVVRLMLTHRISGLPVVEDGAVVGMLSEGDLLHRPEIGTERRRRHWLQLFGSRETDAADYVRTHGMTAGEMMTSDVLSITETTSLEDIATLLESRRIKRVPVLHDGKLVGIVSRADLLRGLASRLSAPKQESDSAIRASLLAELKAHPSWAAMPGDVSALVQDGVVHYWGYVRSTAQRQAMIVAAERTAGVHHVEDHMLDWKEPDPLYRPNWPSPGRP